LSLTRALYPPAGEDFARHNLLGVRSCDSGVAARAIFGTSIHPS